MRAAPFTLRLLIGIALLAAGSARAGDFDMIAVLGLNYHNPSMNPEPSTGGPKAKPAFDFGVLATRELRGPYEFEFGLLRHNRHYDLVSGNATATETRYGGWMVPATLRFMRADFLGIGFGPYLAYFGSNNEVTSDSNGASSTSTVSMGRRRLDLGLRASLHIELPAEIPDLGPTRVVLDLSYLLGFTDLNGAPNAEDKNQELLALIGLRIPLADAETASSARHPPAP